MRVPLQGLVVARMSMPANADVRLAARGHVVRHTVGTLMLSLFSSSPSFLLSLRSWIWPSLACQCTVTLEM